MSKNMDVNCKVAFVYIFIFLCVFVMYFSFKDVTPRENGEYPFYPTHLSIMKNNTGKEQSDMSSNVTESKERDLNNSCKGCAEKVPSVIIQYGPERSGTTLQYQILCLMMIMLHEDEVNSVECFYQFGPFDKKKNHPYKYKVIKTHQIHLLVKSLPKDAWIFMTSKSSLTPNIQKLHSLNLKNIEKENLQVRYTVDISNVTKRGVFIVNEYQSIFGVTNKQMMYLREYLRYWDILRICCGKQMSSDWRNKLSPKKHYNNHHDPHSASFPACEMYNISQVETFFLNSYVVRKYARISSVNDTVGKPSTIDGKLDGHYCERCNINVNKHHLQTINNKCA